MDKKEELREHRTTGKLHGNAQASVSQRTTQRDVPGIGSGPRIMEHGYWTTNQGCNRAQRNQRDLENVKQEYETSTDRLEERASAQDSQISHACKHLRARRRRPSRCVLAAVVCFSIVVSTDSQLNNVVPAPQIVSLVADDPDNLDGAVHAFDPANLQSTSLNAATCDV